LVGREGQMYLLRLEWAKHKLQGYEFRKGP
jgi:hypothetical protein